MSNQQNISSVLYLVCGEQAIFSNARHFGLVMHNQELDWLAVGFECHKTFDGNCSTVQGLLDWALIL